MPESVDIIALVTAHFEAFETLLGRHRSRRTMLRPAPLALGERVRLHVADDRIVGRHRPPVRMLAGASDEVVIVQSVAPAFVLCVLLRERPPERVKEPPSGDAHLTFVALDAAGRPTAVPPLAPDGAIIAPAAASAL